MIHEHEGWSVIVDLKRGGVTGFPIFSAEGVGKRISDAVADAVKNICSYHGPRPGDFLVVGEAERCVYTTEEEED